jgi:hypothetical protein
LNRSSGRLHLRRDSLPNLAKDIALRPGIPRITRLAATAMNDSDLVRLDTHTLRISSTSASSIPVACPENQHTCRRVSHAQIKLLDWRAKDLCLIIAIWHSDQEYAPTALDSCRVCLRRESFSSEYFILRYVTESVRRHVYDICGGRVEFSQCSPWGRVHNTVQHLTSHQCQFFFDAAMMPTTSISSRKS